MQAVALHTSESGRYLDYLTSMYRLRRRVFKDRLDWSVSDSGDLEIDIYDALSPSYLLAVPDKSVIRPFNCGLLSITF